MLRRSRFFSAVALSAVTNKPLPFRAQNDCGKVAQLRNFQSPYWSTAAQIRRGLNSSVKPGEQPVKTALEIDSVVLFKTLPTPVQQRILAAHPPYFDTSVGILSSGFKWNSVGAVRLKRVLQTDEFRSLYVETGFAQLLSGSDWKAKPIDISSESSFELFNAEQLVHPSRGAPLLGCAIDIVTGKRIPQPAHDNLVSLAIIRGYQSPMWVNAMQIPLLSLKIRPGAKPVVASTLAGEVVPLTSIEAKSRKQYQAKMPLNSSLRSANYIYSNGVWERTTSKLVNTALLRACTDNNLPMCRQWISIEDLSPGVSLLKGSVVRVDLAAATKREFYNIEEMLKPHLAVSPNRSIAIVNGRLAGKREELRLKLHGIQNKFYSPLWLTARTAANMGVGIKKNAKPISLERSSSKGSMTLYNIDDFTRPGSILKDKCEKLVKSRVHMVLDSEWKNVLGRHKLAALNSCNRSSNLWVAASEVVIAGYTLKQGAQPVVLGTRGSVITERGAQKDEEDDDEDEEEEECESSRLLYNSMDTTDPVRVMALSPYYSRPQGHVA